MPGFLLIFSFFQWDQMLVTPNRFKKLVRNMVSMFYGEILTVFCLSLLNNALSNLWMGSQIFSPSVIKGTLEGREKVMNEFYSTNYQMDEILNSFPNHIPIIFFLKQRFPTLFHLFRLMEILPLFDEDLNYDLMIKASPLFKNVKLIVIPNSRKLPITSVF